jgi:rhamnosyltransferase subunit B
VGTDSRHFIINTFGSAGDVHPFMALAEQLTARGHSAAILTSGKFRKPIEAAGLRCVAIGRDEDYEAALRDPRLWDSDKALGLVLEMIAASLPETLEAIRAEVASAGRDRCVLVGSSLALPARVARDEMKLPLATVHLAPCLYWSVDDPALFSPELAFLRKLPRFGVRLMYRFFSWMISKRFGAPLDKALRDLGHAPVRDLFSRWYHSPDLVVSFFPDWFGARQEDWPKPHFMAGFPLHSEERSGPLDAELEQFLDAGEAPVIFAPGSANIQAGAFHREAVAACRAIGCRGLLLAPDASSVPGDLPAGVIAVRYAPFARLLPRCRAIVHHAGIGTIAQSFRAGLPQLCMPMAHDQFDNARRVAGLGVGRVLPVKKFRGAAVVRELTLLLNSTSCREKAHAYRERASVGVDCDGLAAALVALEFTGAR